MQRTFIKNQGFRYDLDGKSLLIQIITMTKPNQKLSEEKLKSLIKATSGYLEKVGDIPLTESFQGELFEDCSSDTSSMTFQKFISKETYTQYISKGSFQLGSLGYYRTIENKSSRDEKEGFSNLIIDSGDRQIFTSVISGYDKLILCGTSSNESSNFMRQNFGDCVMTIPNISSFAKRFKNHIGAKKWDLKKVQYNDFKAGQIRKNIKDLSGVSPNISKELFEILIDLSEDASLFIKPFRFQPENELRLVFSMNRNVEEREFYKLPDLLDEIEIKTMANI